MDVENVRVYLNGEIEGLAHPDRPLVREFIPTGKITVTVRADGLPVQSDTARIRAAQRTDVRFGLRAHSPGIRKLTAQGDVRFEKGRYLSPEGRSAFDAYRKVLAADPGNTHARSRILKIMAHFRQAGDRAYRQKDYAGAGKSYRHYRAVAEYAAATFGDSSTKAGLQAVRQRLVTLDHLNRPPEDLLKDGDRYFKRQRYLLPENENAFEMYRAVLESDPSDPHARQRIYEMIQIYHRLTEDAEARDFIRARTYYQNYLFLLKYVNIRFGDQGVSEEMTRVRDRIQRLGTDTRSAEQLVKKGDMYFIAQKFTTPPGKNAFVFYKAALDKNPTRADARKRLREILRRYARWGYQAYDEGDHQAAIRFYRQYLMVEQFLSELRKKEVMRAETDRIEARMIRLESVTALLQEGREHLRTIHICAPGKVRSAFAVYEKALALHPQNRRAGADLRELMRHCLERACEADGAGDYPTAAAAFRQYLPIAKYALHLTGDPNIKREVRKAEGTLKDLEGRMQSAELDRLKQRLSHEFKAYRELRSQENGGENVAGQVVPVLRDIVGTLTALESLYYQLSGKRPDISDKISYIRQVRKGLETEIGARAEKAF
ncbi:hypothetical protein DENIS_2847 [Desulfonema ishimotonii]|uniref:Tetratricopeptide repeat protein n=1 Tax=Desulfonema ishimotonii TaxID=45657 RepID=A0A401FY49_9BACT|nr:hypothetical protein [Desulfonema ishimotonii]GBC61885.1 hypothetical protein DENIS_2847 [Desulfonema ishimotonii]